jgi:hypothetical protein
MRETGLSISPWTGTALYKISFSTVSLVNNIFEHKDAASSQAEETSQRKVDVDEQT